MAVIVDYRSTSIGRSKWLSLVRGSGLQLHCNREGFNVRSPKPDYINLQVVRIGIIANQQNACNSPDSYVGSGGITKNKRSYCRTPKTSNTCGNAAYCMPPGGDKEIPAMGYIFVR
jgi:hypothetical protein